jgi:PAS domain S-box-containing protein
VKAADDGGSAGGAEPSAGGWAGEALLAGLVASVPLAVLALDGRRRVRFANAGAAALFGGTVDDLLGVALADLVAERDRRGDLARIEDAVVDGGRHLELEVRCADGGVAPVGMTFAPLRLDGRVQGVVAVGRDIRDRKRLQHELAAMAEGLRELGEVSDLGMYRLSFDADGRARLDHLNPVLEARLGFTTAQLQRDLSPLWQRLPWDAMARLLAQRAGDEPAGQPVPAVWSHPDGSQVAIELREVPLRDQDGQLTSVLGLVADVTAQRRQQDALAEALRLEQQAAEELRRVDELRRLFLQAVSHELRTPLTSVLGFAATLRDRAPALGPEQVSGMAGRVHRQAERIARLLDDLLDIERLSRGVVDADRRPVDVADLVAAVAAEEGDHLVEVRTVPTPAEVDPAKVERIVVNLLGNARKHAGPDARVEVTVAPHGDGVRLTVDDDGPGLPDHLKTRVFEAFEQGPTATTATSPGTGIGLALVAAFAALHDGRAWAEDSDLGGARFVVDLAGPPAPAADGPGD